MLAIIWAVGHFRPYLFGRRFKIITDHKPLIWLQNLNDQNTKFLRWKTTLASYDFEITYKKESQNVVADALSQIEPNLKIIEGSTERPISSQPLNIYNIQTIFKIGTHFSLTTSAPFTNKIRRTLTEPNFDLEIVSRLLASILKLIKAYAVLATDEIFNVPQEAFIAQFSENNLYKLNRCLTLIEDIPNPNYQISRMSDYHINNNHRGSEETYKYLKKEIYLPQLKNKVSIGTRLR